MGPAGRAQRFLERLIACIDDAVRRYGDKNARMQAAEQLRKTETHNVEAAAKLLA